MKGYWYIIIVFLTLVSCKKPEDRSCFKSVGETQTKEVSLSEFSELELGPHIEFVLVQDTVNKAILTGGKNLLNFIDFSISDDKLIVKNTNRCNFLRSFKKYVTVELHVKNIVNVLFEGTRELTCKNQLNAPYLTFVIRDGAGKCNLNVNSAILHLIVAHGWGNYELSGNVGYLRLDVRNNGFGNAYDLNVNDSIAVVSTTSNTVKLNAEGVDLRAETSSVGDIWYIGSPLTIEHNRYGEGDLIDKN